MQFRTGGGKKSDLPDEELLREFCNTNNPETLGDLCSRYMHLVYGVRLKYLRNRDEAERLIGEGPDRSPVRRNGKKVSDTTRVNVEFK